MKAFLILVSILMATLVLFISKCGQPGKDHHSESEHHHGDANQHMNKTPFEELVKRFESPERDAYQQPEIVMAYIGNVKGKKIMDLGAGTGYFTFRLAKAGALVTAADVDQKFLEYIKDKIRKDSLTNLNIIIKRVPYDDPLLDKGQMDIVIVVNTYHHIEQRRDYFKKVLNGLSKNGELIIIDFFKKELPVGPPPNHKLSPDEVIAELENAGFDNFETNDSLLEYQYIIRARF